LTSSYREKLTGALNASDAYCLILITSWSPKKIPRKFNAALSIPEAI